MAEKRLSGKTVEKIADYLFGKPTEEKDNNTDSMFMDMRTRVKTQAGLNALLFYGILGYTMESFRAIQVKDMLERLFISYEGDGRKEGVSVMAQQFPKRVEIEKGTEPTKEKEPVI